MEQDQFVDKKVWGTQINRYRIGHLAGKKRARQRVLTTSVRPKSTSRWVRVNVSDNISLPLGGRMVETERINAKTEYFRPQFINLPFVDDGHGDPTFPLCG